MRKLKALKWPLLLLLAGLSLWFAIISTQLYRHAQQPADAVLVLGGSIRREIFMAESVAEGNSLPVLISQGSQPPCIRILFDRISAPLDKVWLENCAESTFDNSARAGCHLSHASAPGCLARQNHPGQSWHLGRHDDY